MLVLRPMRSALPAGERLLYQPVRSRLMVGAPARDRRDRARERRAVAGAQLAGEGSYIRN